MAKAPAKALNQTPPANERPPGRTVSPKRQAELDAAAKAEVAEAPAVEPASADDFPEREAADPPATPKPLERRGRDAALDELTAASEEVGGYDHQHSVAPVVTKVEAPPARVQRGKDGKIKSQAKGRGAPKDEPKPKVTEPPKEPAPPPAGDNSLVAEQALTSFIDRIERLEGEKQGLADDIRDVYTAAKLQGFNSGIMRECVKIRKLEPDKRQEKYALLAIYTRALGIDLGFDLI